VKAVGPYHRAMAYDEDLAARIRLVLADEPDVIEKKMFGGLGFLVGGNMAVAASGQGGALVRVDPEASDHLVDGTGAQWAVMRGRPMSGWLQVPAEVLTTREQVKRWVDVGASYARSLPPKG